MADKKMKFSPKFKSDIVAWCKNLRWEFYLNEYTMHFSWVDVVEEGKEGVMADITPDFRYLEFTLCIRPRIYEEYQKGNFREVQKTLVHEFSHMLVDPVYRHAKDRFGSNEWEAFNDIRERQVHRVSIIIGHHLHKRVWEIKKKKPVVNKKKKMKHGAH